VGNPEPDIIGAVSGSDRRRIYTASSQNGRLWHGEIVSDLLQAKLALASLPATISNQVATETTPLAAVRLEYDEHPLVVILSQDCDLEQDYTKRSTKVRPTLYNILLADVFEAKSLQNKLRAEENSGSTDWRKIQGNHAPRFQFLSGVLPDQDASGIGLPALAVDFRLYFSMRTDELYERLGLGLTKRRCRLQTPYAEHLAQRFHSYQARVPLAKEHAGE
jgi:hypothetical protein